MNRTLESGTAIGLLLLLSVSAGCLHPFDGGDRAGTDRNGTETELSSYLLTAQKETVDTTPNNIIDFEELTPRQQNTFERALNGSYHSTRVPTGVDYEVWIDHDYVRYRNETYSVSVAVP